MTDLFGSARYSCQCGIIDRDVQFGADKDDDLPKLLGKMHKAICADHQALSPSCPMDIEGSYENAVGGRVEIKTYKGD